MKKDEIEQQLGVAKQKEQEAETKFNEAKSSAETVISRAEHLVEEHKSTLATATGNHEQAQNKVGYLKHALDVASRGHEKKINEIKVSNSKVSFCDNQIQIYCASKAQYEAQVSQYSQMYFSCQDEKKKANYATQIKVAQAHIAFCDKKIASYDKLRLKTLAEIPSIEKAIEEYKTTIDNVKPRLEFAEEKLKNAIEEEKKAKEAFEQACASRDHDIEFSNQKLREASEAHEKSKVLVREWESHLNSALAELNNYALGGRD